MTNSNKQDIATVFKAFGDFTPAYGPDFKTTADHLADYLVNNSRANVPPPPIQPWEVRIGLCRLIIPPVNIQVSRTFQTGSLSGGAIRQQIPPKFNSGHSETRIIMTMYFPNQESIWGFAGNSLTIDFEQPGNEAVIDQYLSSLRGLLTAFRYTPILPIKNAYLNSTFNITAVALQSITISTERVGDLPLPFCLRVDLELLEFDHTVFLPMVQQLDDALDYGKYRQYMGRAAYIMEQATDKNFATTTFTSTVNAPAKANSKNPNQMAGQIAASAEDAITGSDTYTGQVAFNDLLNYPNASTVNFFYPSDDPAGLITDMSSVANFEPSQANTATNQSWWNAILNGIGLSSGNYGEWAQVTQYLGDANITNQFSILATWLQTNKLAVADMGNDNKNKWIDYYTQQLGANASSQQITEAAIKGTQMWYAQVYQNYINNPSLQTVFDLQDFMRGERLINEWEVPMTPLTLNSTNVVVNAVNVNILNNFARLPLSMRDTPVYQHIGGLGTTIEIDLTVLGETDLTNLRLMYDTINNLSRLEHGHAVLGFLGIQNIITAIAGTKYMVPSSFNVQTVNGVPHTYVVKLVFTDFDIFQQKREMLSSEQQLALVEEFGKANPFLRLKQNWTAFNAYPDFPLSVKDDKGNVVGQLDPDYYFNAYETIDDDIITGIHAHNNETKTDTSNYNVVHHIGGFSPDGTAQSIGLYGGQMDLRTGNDVHTGGFCYNEPHAGNTQTKPLVPGCTPASGYSYPNFELDGSQSNTGLIDGNFTGMIQDAQYRDKSGRMIRAYPTYMLWLIDEGGLYAGVRMFDNFYGLQSVLDFSFVDNEDVMGTTLILRVSNLYSRLSTQYSELLDSQFFPQASVINTQINQIRNIASGTTNYVVNLQTINLQPGTRLHLRVGYSADPNLLETIFNGTITQVESGDIMTITAQSDAIELGPVINNTNPSGSSGDIDGSIASGLWMSEPRDLMVRLLTMGGNTAEEAIAMATNGMIYSQNRWGVRHFGRILYQPLTTHETQAKKAREGFLSQHASSFVSSAALAATAGPVGILAAPIAGLVNTLWTNFSARRDYEIFKRNIYPGNGTGISQYTGGDLGDGGTATAFTPPGVNPDGSISPDASGQITVPDPRQILNISKQVSSGDISAKGNTHSFSFGGLIGNLLGLAGVTNQVTDGVPGSTFGAFGGPFAEVSFRASTYMKTIWDLFLMCGALLPNYIVAVRPFEDRSTIFYGKPHWAYTSGLIPLTTGPSQHQAGLMQLDPSDFSSYDQLQQQIQDAMNQNNKTQDIYSTLNTLTSQAWTTIKQGGTSSADPGTTTAGVAWSGGDISKLPLKHSSGATIPVQTGTLAMEMHLPTNANLQTDINQHIQIADLKSGPDVQYSHPFYMDRVGGPAGGYEKYENPYAPGSTVLGGDNPNAAGKPGAFGYLAPADEQYYMNMGWGGNSGHLPSNYPDAWKGRRILVYCPKTKKGVVCTPGDWGPASWTGRVAGVSPDAWIGLGKPGTNDNCWFGFVDDTTALGPVAFTATDQFQGSGLPNSGTPGANNSTATTSQGTAAVPVSANTSPGKAVTAQTAGKQQGNVPIAYPSWMNGQTGISPAQYALNHGATQQGIPVDFSNKTGLVDQLGDGAKQLYSSFRSDDDANAIWDEFRSHFGTDQETINAFNDIYPNDKNKYDQIVTNFREFMWTSAYNRGWIVLTADAQVQGGIVGGLESDAANLTGGVLDDIGLSSAGSAVKGIGSDVAGAVSTITGLFGFGGGAGGGTSNKWNFSRAHALFKVYIQNGAGDPNANTTGVDAGAISWMRDNAQAGFNQSGLIGRAAEMAGRDVFSHIFDFFTSIAKTAGAILTGVVSTLRLSLMTLTNGLNLSEFAGAQANLLNGVFQDSLYYDPALGTGSLLWRADNPFTREYGEPVVEIREPFQRVHFINSFQHIIANGIIENFNGVATVVTATTDGAHPITVYFDKGAPAERQVEIQVETGLQWQTPHGFSMLLHPIEDIRSFISHFNNGDDATDAKRVALWNLKENLKNIYVGELIILGNAEIRPHDLIYLGDSYERMYGFFEVEQVVHQFSPETGFITSITPNATVIINDPAKWQWGSILGRQGSVLLLRNTLRNTLVNQQNAGAKLSMSADDLANSLSDQLLGTTQYTGGVGGIVKDIGGAYGLGGVTTSGVGNPNDVPGTGVSQTTFGSGGLAEAGSELKTFLEWPAFAFLRDKIFDAHGCYIQYLNRNGTPMDAGLSYNYGSAVGQSNVWTLLSDSLNINIPVSEGGQTQIYTSDILTNLGWNSKQVINQANALSYWTNYTNDQVLKLSGKTSIPVGVTPDFVIAEVTSIIDGNTFSIAQPFLGTTTVRLAYITPPTKQLPGSFNPVPAGTLSPGDPGVVAMNYIQNVLDTLVSEGYNQTVGIRVDPANSKASDGALLATVFYRVPAGTDPGTSINSNEAPTNIRESLLTHYGNTIPPIQWDDYMQDGNAYTLNWEMVVNGAANIDSSLFTGIDVPAGPNG